MLIREEMVSLNREYHDGTPRMSGPILGIDIHAKPIVQLFLANKRELVLFTDVE